MNIRRTSLATVLIPLAFACALSLSSAAVAQSQQAQPQAQSAENPAATFKAETKLVLVDTIVTDKQGNYIRDLTSKDFKVWEDNKEQPIKSFSFQADATSPTHQNRYLVLFFDNSTMDVSDQGRARAAATKFIAANSGPDRYIAVMDFGGALQIAQNFTTDSARLTQVVQGLKFSAVSPNEGSAGETEFGVHSLLQALHYVAKTLASVPGRKSLMLFTSGFTVPTDRESELVAAVDACNKANVAIYPIDVRGLVASRLRTPDDGSFAAVYDSLPAKLVTAVLTTAETQNGAGLQTEDQSAHLVYVQKGGSGGGRPGGTGGSTGGVRSGGNSTGGVTYQPTAPVSYGSIPYRQSRQIVPAFGGAASGPQQVLYRLAMGTGGFVILNTNDLLGGLEKIGKEQSEYYALGYTPPPAEEGSCHSLRVKVERSGTVVRSRSGYCDIKPADALAGKPIEAQLESHADASQPGNIIASMLTPFFYTSANTARVNLAMDIPGNAMKVQKEKGKWQATVNILGIAYAPDGKVAARFSDSAKLEFADKKEIEQYSHKPFHYENQFDLAAGRYNLKVVFSSGGTDFGKLETPLVIEPYDGKQLSLSAVALSKDLRPLSQSAEKLDADLLEDKTLLVSQGFQIVPAGSEQFTKTDRATFYVEIYDPLLLGSSPPKVGIDMRVVDRKSGEEKVKAGGPAPAASLQAGSPVVPLGLRLPVDTLPAGSYRLEVSAQDSAGNRTPPRTANFEVQ